MIKNFLLLFCVSLIGLLLASRTSRTSELNRISGIQSAERVLSILGIAIIASIFILFPSHFLSALFVPPLVLLIATITKKYILQQRHSQFRSHFERFLDVVILEMLAGCSYRLAIENASTAATCPYFQERIQMLQQSLAFAAPETSIQMPKNIANLFRRMTEIDLIAHRQIPRLKTFRQQLRLESEFRHKSGQATRQARAQAWILVGLYIALLIFVLGHFKFQTLSRWIGFSATLMVSGAIGMRWMGQKKRWKV